MAESIISNTHENDVIFNMDSLREFIKLIKRQGTENIDFYAVSELLQPPGDNLMVSTPTGHIDGNLEAWIELYNDTRRQNAENDLKNLFNIHDDDNHGDGALFEVDIYQYIPPIQKIDAVVSPTTGKIGWQTSIERESSFKQVLTRDDLINECIITRRYNLTTGDYDIEKETPNFKNRLNSLPYYKSISLNQKSLGQAYEVYEKEEYKLKYYNSLSLLLKDISTKNTIVKNVETAIANSDQELSEEEKEWIRNINTLYLSVPVLSAEDMRNSKPKLYFVLKSNDKNRLINTLSAYVNYNNQIANLNKVEDIIVYEKKPIENPEGLPWWKFIYTKYNNSMVYDQDGQTKYYLEFNEQELKDNPGKIVIVRKIHPWQQDNTTNNNNPYNINILSGRHLYVQAGSLLKFNPGQSTENKDLINDYWTKTTPGTFSIDENDGQKAHVITIRGFDQNGNFNNKNPIVGYISKEKTPDNTDDNGAYKIGSNDYNLNSDILTSLSQQPDMPVYQNGQVIGYIKSKNIPKESDENGNYEINEQMYNLDPNLIIPIEQANIMPVYLNNNEVNITSHEGNFDVINADVGNFNNLNLIGDNGLISSGVDLLITSDHEGYRRTAEFQSISRDTLASQNIVQLISNEQQKFIVNQVPDHTNNIVGWYLSPPSGPRIGSKTVTNIYSINDIISNGTYVSVAQIIVTGYAPNIDMYGQPMGTTHPLYGIGQSQIFSVTQDTLGQIRMFSNSAIRIIPYDSTKTIFLTNAENYYILKDGAYIQCKNNIEYNDNTFYYINTTDNDPAQGLGYNDAIVTGSIATYGGISARKSIKGFKIYAAVFNDYAECRKTIDLEAGRVVIDNDDGSLSCANARLLPGAQVISDTYGNLIGEMPGVQTPIAVSGRVLVYPYQDRNNYHAGMAVCSAPNGTVDIMTREEIKEYPDCIIGIVSEIPNYDKWGSDQVDVSNRIWIKVK